MSRPLGVFCAVAFLAATGCSGRASAPVRRLAPPESVAVVAVRRFAALEHFGRVVAATCGAARRDGSRPCQVTLTTTCDTYAVRFDPNHHVLVEAADGTCYWIERTDSAVTLPAN